MLRDGPAKHAGRDYWLSTETFTGPQVAVVLSEVLGTTVTCDIRQPEEFEALFQAGALQVEHWYAKGAVDWVLQIKDGRMGYLGSVRDEVPHILGRPAMTLAEWTAENRDELLTAISTPR